MTDFVLFKPDPIIAIPDNSKTWKIDYDQKRILHEFVNEAEMVGQEAWGALSVERYGWYIHSDNYGVEFAQMWGKPPTVMMSRLELLIKDALSRDERIADVTNFEMSIDVNDVITASFDVVTIYGTQREEVVISAQ